MEGGGPHGDVLQVVLKSRLPWTAENLLVQQRSRCIINNFDRWPAALGPIDLDERDVAGRIVAPLGGCGYSLIMKLKTCWPFSILKIIINA